MHLTSAAGVIALLDEPETELKYYALDKLDSIVNDFWPEIADVISKIEELCENDSFKHKDLSSLVASKVYYHLGAFEDSVMYALGSGDRFNVNGHTEYIETTIAKCIDLYTQLRVSRQKMAAPLTQKLMIGWKLSLTKCFKGASPTKSSSRQLE